MTHTPDQHGADATHAEASATTATPRRPYNRPLLLLVAGAVVTAAALTTTLVADGNSGKQSSTPTAGPSTSPPASTTPDPLVSATEPAQDDATVTDETGLAEEEADQVLQSWASTNPASAGDHAVSGPAPAGRGGAVQEILRIPALGSTWAQPVYDGVADKQLRSGIGHFPGTEQPGQIGNYVLAGHRSGVSVPALRDIDNVRRGATISVTTAQRITYTYTVTRVRTVDPADVEVIAQVPGEPDAVPTKAKLTLVTCWPANGHSKRVVVEADLTSSKGGA